MVLCVLSSMAAGVSSAAEPVFDIDIPAMNAAEALNRLADQTGSVMLFSYDLARAREANAVRGRYTLLEGLELLLRDTGLSGGLSDKRVVIIAANGNVPGGKGETVKKRGLLATLIAALFGSTAGESSADQTEERTRQETPIEEIIVTAQKQQERIQDVPVPVTALDAQALTESNQLRVQDYYNKIPGFSLVLSGNGSTPVVAIRGITTGGDTNPTVGVVVDEVSYGASANTGQSTPAVADIDPGDLARVEVLRGPQGTLYGASSMGGLLKFVTVDPSTDRLNGRVQVGATNVSRSSDTGYSVRGSINVPLSDTFAVRASGFTLRDPGYIDNAETGEKDANRRDSDGGRLTALWRPSDAFSLKFSALFQQSGRRGTEDVDTTLGDDPQQNFLRQSGFYERNTEAYSATMTGQLGSVEIVSATGYSIDEGNDSIDFSAAFGGFFSGLALTLFGVDREVTVQHNEVKKFTQELRTSFPIGGKLNWLLGAFYTDEDTFRINDNRAADSTGATVGSIQGTVYGPATFEESAVFTTLTYTATKRWDIQFGGRYSSDRQDFSRVIAGERFVGPPFNAPGGILVTDTLKSKDQAFTYLVTPRFRASPNLMAYARVASGFRPGGPNIGCGLDPALPCEFDADTTTNYEIGVKGGAADRMLSFDASVYYIDWNDIQISNIFVPGTFLFYTDNVSGAKSEGVELSVEARAHRGLTLAAWAAYNNAELAAAFPPNSSLAGQSGDRLPYSSRVSGGVSLDRDFPLASGATIFVGGTLSYTGDRKGNFQGLDVPRETFPSYEQLNLRSGWRRDTWSLNLFANNVTDKRGILRSGADASLFNYVTYIQPRTIGLSVSKTFE